MASHLGRDEAHVDDVLSISRRDSLDGRYNLCEPAADQLARPWAGASRLLGIVLSAHLLIVSGKIWAPLVQLIDELDNRFTRPSAQKCYPQGRQRKHRGFARCAYGGYDGPPPSGAYRQNSNADREVPAFL